MLCFTYGSNMSARRLRARVPSARCVAVATLARHQLRFHKRSREDGSAKCDAFYTRNPEDRVVGVIYDIDAAEKGVLDRFEGLGHGYDETVVTATTHAGERLDAQIYTATDIAESLIPYRWYHYHVLVGARENDFPRDYIEAIERTPVREDPDPERHRVEMAVYEPGH